MGQYYMVVAMEKESGKIVKVTCPHSHKTDKCKFIGAKLMEHSFSPIYYHTILNFIKENPNLAIVEAGDYADEEKGTTHNLYTMACELEDSDGYKIQTNEKSPKVRYIVNNDKHEYTTIWGDKDDYGWRVGKLFLLCADGNGRGGGDYFGKSQDLVGRWCRDRISVAANKAEIPAHYTYLKAEFPE